MPTDAKKIDGEVSCIVTAISSKKFKTHSPILSEISKKARKAAKKPKQPKASHAGVNNGASASGLVAAARPAPPTLILPAASPAPRGHGDPFANSALAGSCGCGLRTPAHQVTAPPHPRVPACSRPGHVVATLPRRPRLCVAATSLTRRDPCRVVATGSHRDGSAVAATRPRSDDTPPVAVTTFPLGRGVWRRL